MFSINHYNLQRHPLGSLILALRLSYGCYRNKETFYIEAVITLTLNTKSLSNAKTSMVVEGSNLCILILQARTLLLKLVAMT